MIIKDSQVGKIVSLIDGLCYRYESEPFYAIFLSILSSTSELWPLRQPFSQSTAASFW